MAHIRPFLRGETGATGAEGGTGCLCRPPGLRCPARWRARPSRSGTRRPKRRPSHWRAPGRRRRRSTRRRRRDRRPDRSCPPPKEHEAPRPDGVGGEARPVLRRRRDRPPGAALGVERAPPAPLRHGSTLVLRYFCDMADAEIAQSASSPGSAPGTAPRRCPSLRLRCPPSSPHTPSTHEALSLLQIRPQRRALSPRLSGPPGPPSLRLTVSPHA
jgi:hypothetical protein